MFHVVTIFTITALVGPVVPAVPPEITQAKLKFVKSKPLGTTKDRF
jgi:hypothetical protein